MYKKPILYQRIAKRKFRKKTSVIGIYGIHRYVGVTHLTLLFAFYLSDVCGYKVIVIEASGKDDIGSLSKLYQVQTQCITKNTFLFRNVMFVGQASTYEIGDYRNSTYDYCILDLGGNYQYASNELMRCDLKLIVGSTAPWRQKSWYELEDILLNIKDLSSWCVIQNLSTKNRKVKINGIRKYYMLGLEANVLHPTREAIKIFREIMQFL